MNQPDLLDEAVPPPPKPRRRRLLWMGLALLLLLTACGGFYGILLYVSDRDLRQAEAEADRLDPDGWRLEDIEAHRKVLSDEENAAVVVRALKSKLPGSWPLPRPAPPAADAPEGDGAAAPAWSPPAQQVYVDNDLSDLPPPVLLDAALLRDLRADLKAAEPALADARKLAGLRDGRFPLTYSRDFISTVISSQDARTAVSLMRHQAVLLAQEGKADEALEATRAALVSGRSIGDEPLLISTLIRIACDAVTVRTLERVLAQGEPSAAELKKMQELLQAEADERLLLIGMRGERALQHEMMRAMKTGDLKFSTVTGPGGAPGFTDVLGPTLARRSHAHLLHIMTRYVEVAKMPPEQQDEPLKQLEREVKQAKVDYDVMTALLVPAVNKVAEASRRVQADQRCALVALAAERYRRDHGRWPASLDQLAPDYLKAVPADPYDGKPLRYQRRPDGVIIYSVGPDREDNGGALNRSRPLDKGIDYGFRLWDVDRRRQPAAEVLPPPVEGFAPPDEAAP
jgi:hypothetical protein